MIQIKNETNFYERKQKTNYTKKKKQKKKKTKNKTKQNKNIFSTQTHMLIKQGRLKELFSLF